MVVEAANSFGFGFVIAAAKTKELKGISGVIKSGISVELDLEWDLERNFERELESSFEWNFDLSFELPLDVESTIVCNVEHGEGRETEEGDESREINGEVRGEEAIILFSTKLFWIFSCPIFSTFE